MMITETGDRPMKTETAQHTPVPCNCKVGKWVWPDKTKGQLGTGPVDFEIVHCPLHATAPELLEALKALVLKLDPYNLGTSELAARWNLDLRTVDEIMAAKKAIARAEGR